MNDTPDDDPLANFDLYAQGVETNIQKKSELKFIWRKGLCQEHMTSMY